MKTFTAKEAKNRLGKVIDATLSEGVVMITKNGRESVVMVSADKFYQLAGAQGFIRDDLQAKKNVQRSEFSRQVKSGFARSTDASMFHGLAAKSKVQYLSDEY